MTELSPIENLYPNAASTITPDQYDKLMRRLYIMEQKITVLGQQDYKATEIDKVFDRQAKIENRLKRIDKMLVKIGLKLFHRAVSIDFGGER